MAKIPMRAAYLAVIVLLVSGGLYVWLTTSTLQAGTHPVPPFAASSSGTVWWVGASSTDSSALPNTGVQGTIQVISTAVVGCLAFWVADDLSNSIWGQVGYYICNSSTPVAFYQIWNLGSDTILTSGSTSVSVGTHTFSMYLQSGTTWAYSLDGTVFGTYNMGASVSSSTYPVYALSEEEANSTFAFPAVTFSTALQVMKSDSWNPVQTAESYGTSWGVVGAAQGTGLQADQITVGGSLAVLPQGTELWSTGSTSTTSSSSTSSSRSTSTSSTATLTSVTSTTESTATSTATSTVASTPTSTVTSTTTKTTSSTGNSPTTTTSTVKTTQTSTGTVTSTTTKTTTSAMTSPTTVTSTVKTTQTSTGTVTSTTAKTTTSTVNSPTTVTSTVKTTQTSTTRTATTTSMVTSTTIPTLTNTQTSTGTVTSTSTVILPQPMTTANQAMTTTDTQTMTSTVILNQTSTVTAPLTVTSTTVSTSIQPTTVTETISSQVTTTATETVPSTATVTVTLSGTPATSSTCGNGTRSPSNPCPSTGATSGALPSIEEGSILAILAVSLTGLALVVNRRIHS